MRTDAERQGHPRNEPARGIELVAYEGTMYLSDLAFTPIAEASCY